MNYAVARRKICAYLLFQLNSPVCRSEINDKVLKFDSYLDIFKVEKISNIVEQIIVGGFRELGDGGQAVYKKTNKKNDCIFEVFGQKWTLNLNAIDKVFPEIFGAIGDSEHDDTEHFQSAINFLANCGGGDLFLKNKKYLIGDITVKSGVCIFGTNGLFDPRKSIKINSAKFSLLIKNNSSIYFDEASSMRGVNIIKFDGIYPQSAEKINQWSGCALKVKNGSHGVYIGYCNIIGFNKAIDADGTESGGAIEQLRLEYLNIDCTNGVFVGYMTDVSYLDNIHCWPVASVGLVLGKKITRDGVAFNINGKFDWCIMTKCFSYGYKNGLNIKNAKDVTISMCGFDNDPNNSKGSIGIKISGNSSNISIVDTQIAAQEVGLVLDLIDNTNFVSLVGCRFWDNYKESIVLLIGKAFVDNCRFFVRGGIFVGKKSELSISGEYFNIKNSKNDIHVEN